VRAFDTYVESNCPKNATTSMFRELALLLDVGFGNIVYRFLIGAC